MPGWPRVRGCRGPESHYFDATERDYRCYLDSERDSVAAISLETDSLNNIRLSGQRS